MKIGIILHPYEENEPAGLGRAIYEWTKALLLEDQKNEYIIFLKYKQQNRIKLPGSNWKIEQLGGGYFWLDRLRKKTLCDMYIFNTPVMPILFKPKKSIILALDFAYYYLAPKDFKSQIQKSITFFYHKFSLKRATYIVAISEATKKDLLKLFNIHNEKIKVIPIGYKKICDISTNKITLPSKFFFFVGVHKKRKNVLNIIKAYKIFSSKFSGISLVLAGNQNGHYFDMLLKYVNDNNLNNSVVFIGRLDDGQLSYVYKNSYAFIFPTLIEGFGMPILEAMNCGIPVITSNCSALSEVASYAALLVNPYNSEDIAQAMSKIVSNENLRLDLIKKGKIRSKEFSWDIAAKGLLKIIYSK